MKKYLLSAVLCSVLSWSVASAMHREADSGDAVEGSSRAPVVSVDEYDRRFTPRGDAGGVQAVFRDVPRNLTRLHFQFGNLTQTDSLDTLFEKLLGFPGLRKLTIQVRDANGDVVRGLMVQTGILGCNADLPEATIHNLMRLGLSGAELHQIGRVEDAGASFAPTFSLETPEPFNWEVPDDPEGMQRPLLYAEIIQGKTAEEARDALDALFANPEMVQAAMAAEGYDVATAERRHDDYS